MTLLYSLFFGAGVAAVAYVKLGRRAGYQNAQNVWTIVGVIFIISSIVFFSVLSLFL